MREMPDNFLLCLVKQLGILRQCIFSLSNSHYRMTNGNNQGVLSRCTVHGQVIGTGGNFKEKTIRLNLLITSKVIGMKLKTHNKQIKSDVALRATRGIKGVMFLQCLPEMTKGH